MTCGLIVMFVAGASKFLPKFTVWNSLQLINRIKNINIDNSSKLVSFHVRSLKYLCIGKSDRKLDYKNTRSG